MNWQWAPRLTPRDAQLYWISRRLPTDQYLLYAFDATGQLPELLKQELLQRACQMPDFRVRVSEVVRNLDYPYWDPASPGEDAVVVRRAASWEDLRQQLGDLLSTPLDARELPWRLHLFPEVSDAPGDSATVTVVVLQTAHALADGQLASRLARTLFDTSVLPPAPHLRTPGPVARCLWGAIRFPILFGATVFYGSRAGVAAWRGSHGKVEGQPPAMLNSNADDRHAVHMILLRRNSLRSKSATVTVAVLAAIGTAMQRYLAGRGEPTPRLYAEVTIADKDKTQARNSFHNSGVCLYVEEPDLRQRMARIGAELRACRVPGSSSLARAQAAVARVLPAAGLAADVARYQLAQPPAAVTGHTVVSSVDRGPADLSLAGGQIRFTAGFPALSPAMGLTHGVHGIGEYIVVSVHASPGVLPDMDDYVVMLRQALAQAGASTVSGASAALE